MQGSKAMAINSENSGWLVAFASGFRQEMERRRRSQLLLHLVRKNGPKQVHWRGERAGNKLCARAGSQGMKWAS